MSETNGMRFISRCLACVCRMWAIERQERDATTAVLVRLVLMPTGNPLTSKLQCFTPLTGAETAALDKLAGGKQMRFAARRDLAREGDASPPAWLILEGWAARYKMLADGRRQIVGFLLPGDLWDLDAAAMDRLDHSLAAVSVLRCVAIQPQQIEDLMQSANLGRALAWDRMMGAAIQRDWIVSLGQRTALERVANLICELYLRLERLGLAQDCQCVLPITQRDLAAATGLSTVHVNRVLKELRQRGLIEWRGRILRIPDPSALMDQALFSAPGLWLRPPKRARGT